MGGTTLAFYGGPIVALFAAFLMSLGDFPPAAAITLGITTWCIIWWIFEPVPIPATSLLPLTLLPLLGVLDRHQLSSAYGHPLILLMLSGFLLSTALAHNNAHKRLAFGMLRAFGGRSNRQLVIGFMAAAALLSMWISNTATALMLLPVALAVLDRNGNPELRIPLLLGIAYGCSLGGMGTPIGTPPNVVFMGVYEQITGTTVSFVDWMRWAIPIVIVFFPIMAWWLTRNLRGAASASLPDLGPWQPAERRVLLIFGLTALAWMTRTGPFGGWAGAFDLAYTNDAMAGFLGVIAMFVASNGRGGRLLDWETANAIPWGTLLLFAGGLAIAAAFGSSGLSAVIGDALSGAGDLNPLLLTAIICFTVTFLTEATSNTATSSLLLPLVGAIAVAAAIDPRLLMVPVALSASCAFMLPVATPPNVIIFSTGEVPISRMVQEGFAMNIVGVFLISGGLYLLL